MNLSGLALTCSVILGACSSVPSDPYERRVYDTQQQAQRAASVAVDNAPEWMTKLPVSTSAVYATGTAVSSDLAMAENKAKLVAFGKICMAAGGRVDQRNQLFVQEHNDVAVNSSEMAIRSMCPSVDLTGVEIKEARRVNEQGRFRSYILVALPLDQANVLQQRRDRVRLQENNQKRADQMFSTMDQPRQ